MEDPAAAGVMDPIANAFVCEFARRALWLVGGSPAPPPGSSDCSVGAALMMFVGRRRRK